MSTEMLVRRTCTRCAYSETKTQGDRGEWRDLDLKWSRTGSNGTHPELFDLCPECVESFRAWVADPSDVALRRRLDKIGVE